LVARYEPGSVCTADEDLGDDASADGAQLEPVRDDLGFLEDVVVGAAGFEPATSRV
jgi:hypothetical protein